MYRRIRAGSVFFGIIIIAAGVFADDDVTARAPLAPPLFSIDRASPEVQDAVLSAADLLRPGAGPLYPDVIVPAGNMSLFSLLDDIDALSLDAWTGDATTPYALIFSIDRNAVGSAPPDATLAALGLPFNVQEQALKNQAAGDAYMSLLLFTRLGPIPPLRGSHAYNNTLVLNQGDAGGVHFQVNPAGASPSTPLPPANIANVDAGGGTHAGGAATFGPVPIEEVLFSLTSDSPSLAFLPGNQSGADIYVDRDPSQPGGEQLYLGFLQLGLMPGDDIDAMIVLDSDTPFSFDPGVDHVIFSLAPESPGLAPTQGPGDLFISAGAGVFNLFCPAESLGLFPWDNVNLLDFVPCEEILPCADQWAIGFVDAPCVGDLDGDRDVDLTDLAALLAAYGTCVGDADYLPAADFDENDCINLSDLATLLTHYGETCPPLLDSGNALF